MKKINIILVLLVMLLSGCSKIDDAQDETTTYYVSEDETTEMTSASISDGLKAVYELTDKVYFGNDMQLWTDFSLSAKALHKGFCSDVCEIEIEGERCKAMYTDEEGIVIYNHNGNLVAYAHGTNDKIKMVNPMNPDVSAYTPVSIHFMLFSSVFNKKVGEFIQRGI